MEQGSRFRVTASITNNAGVPLRDGEVTLHVHFDSIIVLDAEDGDIAGPSTRKLGTLNPGPHEDQALERGASTTWRPPVPTW